MPPLSRVFLAGAAFGIGICTAVFTPSIMRGGLWGRDPLGFLSEVSPTLACWYAVPFFALAFVGERFRLGPWIAGMGATMLVQSVHLVDIVMRPGGGVNFLLGPLILISPLAITAMVLLLDWLASDPSKATR